MSRARKDVPRVSHEFETWSETLGSALRCSYSSNNASVGLNSSTGRFEGKLDNIIMKF